MKLTKASPIASPMQKSKQGGKKKEQNGEGKLSNCAPSDGLELLCGLILFWIQLSPGQLFYLYHPHCDWLPDFASLAVTDLVRVFLHQKSQ